jgi:DNA-binding transcriptional LysR family regulator
MATDQLPHLETFAKAAERSSFTAAARDLGLTQAAISQRIQALELVLKTPLFLRQGGHVLLTDAGRSLYDYAQRILLLHREAIREIAGRESPLSGELSLAASSVPGEHLLPDLLAKFRDKHPYVQVRASVTDTEQVIQLVEKGQVHLGLVGGKRDCPHLEFRRFASDQLAVVVSAEHPWAKRKNIPLTAFLEQPLIVREEGSGSRACLEQELGQLGHAWHELHIAFELGSNEAIKEAVVRGMGAAVLSSRVVEKEIQAKKLHVVHVQGLTLTREMSIVWDQRRVLPIPARQFLDQLNGAA